MTDQQKWHQYTRRMFLQVSEFKQFNLYFSPEVAKQDLQKQLSWYVTECLQPCLILDVIRSNILPFLKIEDHMIYYFMDFEKRLNLLGMTVDRERHNRQWWCQISEHSGFDGRSVEIEVEEFPFAKKFSIRYCLACQHIEMVRWPNSMKYGLTPQSVEIWMDDFVKNITIAKLS